jgi:ADP-dependent NAD(P)H-hydrate dehydratase / NAD(P)H-hydrate epimerase
VLAVGGARRGGAGYINYLARETLPTELILHAYPDVVPLNPIADSEEISKCGTALIGPGSPAATELPDVARLIVDGGALQLLDKRPIRRDQILVLTPHEGEAKKMGFDTSDREECAISLAKSFNGIALLKGFHSIVATPSGIVHIDEMGGPELSTAGTGDVLAGLIASMLASHQPTTIDSAATIVVRALTIFTSAAKSAITHRAPLVATDLLDEIPRQLAIDPTR